MSTEETDQVTVRPATHADCEAIKAIDRDLYGGFDRFLYYFHWDINVETKLSYVAEISGQIVGYGSGHVIDDGDTIVMRDGRVSAKYRGRQVVRKLAEGQITAAMARFPNLRRRVWISNDDKATTWAMIHSPSIKRLLLCPVETFRIHSDQLKISYNSKAFSSLASNYHIDGIAPFSKYEALKLLTEEIRYLDFVPVRPMIGWQPSGWHVSTLGNQLQITDLFVSRCPNTNKMLAFSFLTTMRSDFGIKTGIEFYCDPKAGVEYLTIAHLLHFIRELARFHSYTNIIGYFHYPAEVSQECIRKVLNVELGINLLPSDISHVLEYNLFDEAGLKGRL